MKIYIYIYIYYIYRYLCAMVAYMCEYVCVWEHLCVCVCARTCTCVCARVCACVRCVCYTDPLLSAVLTLMCGVRGWLVYNMHIWDYIEVLYIYIYALRCVWKCIYIHIINTKINLNPALKLIRNVFWNING